MKGLASILADTVTKSDISQNSKKRVPLKISAYPNDVIVYYDDIAVVYHAEGEGNERHDISEAVYNLATEITGTMQTDPEFMTPEEITDDIFIPQSDPYYKEITQA